MIAGPQIVSAILIATSSRARKNSIAYVAGVIVATSIGTAICYFVTKGLQVSIGASEDSTATTIDYAIIGLLLVLMVVVFGKRKDTDPPKWMGKLQEADPRFCFRLGFLLFFLMPTDIITMITVGSYLSGRDESLWNALPFLLLTWVLIGLPLLILVLFGERAEVTLPKIRRWMDTNSWVVSEGVIVFFLAMQISSL